MIAADLRVADTDRQAIADQLSKHYADGRLELAEFDERLSQAMAAKFGRDLDGLLTDLPDLNPAPRITQTSTSTLRLQPEPMRYHARSYRIGPSPARIRFMIIIFTVVFLLVDPAVGAHIAHSFSIFFHTLGTPRR